MMVESVTATVIEQASHVLISVVVDTDFTGKTVVKYCVHFSISRSGGEKP